jgi:NTE family protein
MDPYAGAEIVLDAWHQLTMHQVFRSPVARALPKAAQYVKQVAGRGHLVSLFDTAPLHGTAEKIMRPHAQALHDNIHGPRPVVDALAVVATEDTDRTTVFVETRDGRRPPVSDPVRAIDYRRATITCDHLLASSAMPALFPPIWLDGHAYVDGGVRLNVPLKPAIKLDATHLAVVATHPARYPTNGAAHPPRTRDVVDGAVLVLDAVLADRMVEDLHTLGTLNATLGSRHQGRKKAGRSWIPYVFVGPHCRHELGEHAGRVYQRRHSGGNAFPRDRSHDPA